jgi:ferritin
MTESETTQRIATLEKHLSKLWEEYDDRRSQFGDDYLWEKHEDAEVIEEIEAFVAKIQQG